MNSVTNIINSRTSALQASIDSQYATLTAQLNEDVATLTNKVNAALADIAGIVSSVMPNYSKAFAIPNGWTATCDCFVHVMGVQDIGWTHVYINGVDFLISYDVDKGQSAACGQFLLSKGDTISWNAAHQAIAIPLKANK